MINKLAIKELERLKNECDKYSYISTKITPNKRRDPVMWLYYYLVWEETEVNSIMIDGIHKRGESFHLDHIIPISFGFKNGISPKIIGSIENIRIIRSDENLRKLDRMYLESDMLMSYFGLEKIKQIKTKKGKARRKYRDSVFQAKYSDIIKKPKPPTEKELLPTNLSTSDRDIIILNSFINTFGEFSLI